MTTISVDKEVWEEITHRLRLGRDSRNKVLRRLLGLDQDGVIVVEGEADIVTTGGQPMWATVDDKSLHTMLNELLGRQWKNKIRITIEKVE